MATSPIQVAGVERFDIVQQVLGPIEKRNPKQCEFLHQLFDKYAKFILYGGAAGGGKSYILRWSQIIFLMLCWERYKVPHVRTGLFCEDYPSLRDRQLSKLIHEVPKFLGRLKKTEAEGLVWQMPESLGGGFIAPRNLDKPEKYDSVEFGMIGIDEFTKNPPENYRGESIFNELRKRLRWPGFPPDFVFPFAAGSNPGGPGHGLAKGLWIDGEFPPELEEFTGPPVRSEHALTHGKFVFIQALATDNQYNPPTYYKDLLSLPEQLRRAYAFGDWDAFLGQYFGEWRRSVHVCPKFTIPHYWRRFTAEDWGFSSPWCRLWFAVSPEGRVIAYREQYERNRLPDWMAERGKFYSQGETIAYRLGDPSMWDEEYGKSHGLVGPSIADQLHSHGWELVKANNARIAGWQHVRAFLSYERNKEGQITRWPMFQVMEGTCPNLIRTVPLMIFDKTNPEDLDTDAEDHAPDTLRYGLMSQPKPTIVPLEEMETEWAEAAMRAAHNESKRPRPM